MMMGIKPAMVRRTKRFKGTNFKFRFGVSHVMRSCIRTFLIGPDLKIVHDMGMGIETFQTYYFHCAAARFSIFTYAAKALGLSKALISKTVAVRIDYIITERG
jgi:hypothetical protein